MKPTGYPTEVIRGHDLGDVLCGMIDRANAFGTALAGPDGDPSPSVSALRAASLSQFNSTRDGGTPNKLPPSDQ